MRHSRSPFTEQMRLEDHNEPSVLKHLTEQTGLTYSIERHPVRVLFVEKTE
jgi:hypothetical protein